MPVPVGAAISVAAPEAATGNVADGRDRAAGREQDHAQPSGQHPDAVSAGKAKHQQPTQVDRGDPE
jgi:hypothetical protein